MRQQRPLSLPKTEDDPHLHLAPGQGFGGGDDAPLIPRPHGLLEVENRFLGVQAARVERRLVRDARAG